MPDEAGELYLQKRSKLV